MKILLINPPIEDYFFTPGRAYPLGLLYLATVLNNHGFEVKIFNAQEEYTKRTVPAPEEFAYLKKYYHPNKSAFCLFSNYYRFGSDYKHIEHAAREFKPDIAGISANFSAYLDSSITVAKLIKGIDKRIVVVLGGRAATTMPEFVLSNEYVDFVLRGEAEFGLLELCRKIKNGNTENIKGLCYKRNSAAPAVDGKILEVEDLDALPVLNIEFVDFNKYRFNGKTMISLLTSRGCAMQCSFCAINESFRFRSAEHVFKEIEYCFSLGVRHFNFEDDTINLNTEFEKLLDGLIEKFSGRISISFMNGLLSLGLNRGLQDKLVKAGLTHLDLSIVSSNEQLLKNMSRSEKVCDVFELAEKMAKRKITPTAHFIIALPGQKFEDALNDMRLLAGKPVLLGPSIFYPVVESSMYKDYQDKDSLFSPENYRFFRSSAACYDKEISRNRIFLLFSFSRIINFIKLLMDEFNIEDMGIKEFLRQKTKALEIRSNCIDSVQRMDKSTLSFILLYSIIDEQFFYYAEGLKRREGFLYYFKKEEFFDQQDIRKIMNGLKITSVCGKNQLI
ncbi:MAG: B12-binding domain-containing radical SAM protein [Candidatus Omnitrophica bacterium]|nr:B12-binding domain-containing radical SAM protein [Candidatus Omnitrophota bacterium]